MASDPRLELRPVERLVDAARFARRFLNPIQSRELDTAIKPFDDYDDTGPNNRYSHGCIPCSVITDQYDVDRSGKDHSECDRDPDPA